MNNWAEVQEWTEQITRQAADRAMHLLDAGTKVSRKTDGTLVTEIDREIERFLRDAISARYPDHAILGEEYGYQGTTDAPLWAIDPIDGTVNLANGVPHWGVSVGLIADGEPVVGVVAFPLLGEFYSGAKGNGATRNGVPLSPLPSGGPTTWDQTYAICSFSVRAIDFSHVPVRPRVNGSAALDVCWTAAGFVAGCQSIGVSLYDVAAGICLAKEMGADVGWLSGEDWSALDLLQQGKRENDVLLIAPPATLAFLRENVRWRTGS
ncbi:MAG: inositol monophosphatase family protein [Armatimonadaceae bacterium]